MIEITRSYRLDAPQDRVWQLLMDTNALVLCIPGCRSLDPEPGAENRYRVSLAVKLAAVVGTYDGTVELVDLTPMQSYGLLAEGRGRPGFVKGKAAIALASEAATTTLTVTGEVHAGGAIARVGQRIIKSAARLMMDRFFKRLKALAEARAKGGADLDIAALEAAEMDSAEEYFETPADDS
jgi:carbon monoxide dehydrogenase subunit G